MKRFFASTRHSIFPVAGAGFSGFSSCVCESAVPEDSSAKRPDRLKGFGLGDIPSSAYKEHFAVAYDSAAVASASNVAQRLDTDNEENVKDRSYRLSLAGHLMSKLGYTREELDLIGEDILRMQGVRSPFSAAALRSGETVLDLGSGFGIDAFLAAEKVSPGGRVIGVDISNEEVRKAANRARSRGLSEQSCCFLHGDAESLPMDSASVDVVISNGAFCLCPDKRAGFKEIHRVLRPGGRFAVACTVLMQKLPPLEGKRWPPCMEVFMLRADVESMLTDMGFSAVCVNDEDARMDVWEFADKDLDCIASTLGAAADGGGCSHARKAAERRARNEVETFLEKDREAGIHWGNPQFDHIKEFDMNELCARVVIYAEKV